MYHLKPKPEFLVNPDKRSFNRHKFKIMLLTCDFKRKKYFGLISYQISGQKKFFGLASAIKFIVASE